MVNYIAHRINTIGELKDLPYIYGVELDLRDDYEGNIYIQHNPFVRGDNFEEYIKYYHHGTMICNIKSERIEYKCMELLEKYNIQDYFFLDSSFPMIWSLIQMQERRVAIRVSEYEGMDTARNMAGKCEWIWMDVFSKVPLSNQDVIELKQMGYKICVVSPELQGRESDIVEYAQIIKKFEVDSICTKYCNIEKWKNLLGS